MILIRDTTSDLARRLTAHGSVATIGNFDGVHLGHQALLKRVIDRAEAFAGAARIAIVFEPQPKEFFEGPRAPGRIMDLREKFQAMQGFDLDCLYCLPFNRSLQQRSANDFVSDVLVKGLGLKYLVIGDDFRYGSDRAGSFSHLASYGQKALYPDGSGFGVEASETITHAGQRVSSTRIRSLFANGQLDAAAALLGRSYRKLGRVSFGRQLGRTIGAPTANIVLQKRPALTGVFCTRVRLPDSATWHAAVANIGSRPTVDKARADGAQHYYLEVHLLDWTGDLYGKMIEVEFCKKLRSEAAFDSIEQLKQQIALDIASAKAYWKQAANCYE
ncbi:bifunctional riboflavin kinase/FAD synthetase [Allohahella marinimesophila]|uniref:Riboflavin biosynthesis protein n=1 Tax=Allohahella marinimesophila TaxID=1054972 RepID=A0ABP7PVY8_9GAMM